MRENRRQILLEAAGCVALACILRIPLRPPHLFSDDCVSFADALDRFDPQMWHPQPPGYPLFVLQSKLIHLFVPSVEGTFLVGVIAATALALFMALRLGREMFGSWLAGAFGAALLLVNPTFVFTGLTSTIRCYEATVPLVVGYFCWRLWRGEPSYWWKAALALGIASGYRPQTLALLFPLWAWSAWRAKRNLRQFGAGLAVAALSSGAWILFLFSRFDSLARVWTTFTIYSRNQFRNSSPLFHAPLDGWLRMLGMLLAWNGLAVAGWILFRLFARPRAQRGSALFLALWILPAAAFNATIHIGAPDQALMTICALCLLGGGVLASLFASSRLAGGGALAFALTLNLLAFWRPLPLEPFPVRSGIKGNLLYMRKQITDGLWETSWSCYRTVNEKSEKALVTLGRMLADSKPGETLTVWHVSPVSWRKLAHYFPEETYCLLQDQLHTDVYRVEAECWQGSTFLHRYDGSPVPIPLGTARRIIWVLGENSQAKAALGPRLHLAGPGGIYWSRAVPTELPGFRFVN